MKSHVQVPKMLLKEFCIDGKLVYLNINKKKIENGDLGFNQIKGYYSEELEEKLSKGVEQPFGLAKSKIKMFFKGNNRYLRLNENEIEGIKNFFAASYYRSKDALAKFEKYSKTADWFKPNENHEALIKMTLDKNDKIENFFALMTPTIIYNRTKRNYVLCKNCFFILEIKGIKLFAIAITPKILIVLGNSIELKGMLNAENADFISISDEKSIDEINIYSLQTEKILGEGFIISVSIEELIFIQKHILEQVTSI